MSAAFASGSGFAVVVDARKPAGSATQAPLPRTDDTQAIAAAAILRAAGAIATGEA